MILVLYSFDGIFCRVEDVSEYNEEADLLLIFIFILSAALDFLTVDSKSFGDFTISGYSVFIFLTFFSIMLGHKFVVLISSNDSS